MRIVTFSHQGTTRHGTLAGDLILVHPDAKSAVDVALGPATGGAGDGIARSDVTLLAPVPRPGKVVCIGLNYGAHAAEGGNPIPDYPAVFLRCATSLVGPQSSMILPECSDKLDFEAELAVVIGRTRHECEAEPARLRCRLLLLQRRAPSEIINGSRASGPRARISTRPACSARRWSRRTSCRTVPPDCA